MMMTHTPKAAGFKPMPAGDHYTVANGMILTCNEDGTIPLNSRVIAESATPDAIDLIHRANTQPDLLELARFVLMQKADGMNDDEIAANHNGYNIETAARAAIDKAVGK